MTVKKKAPRTGAGSNLRQPGAGYNPNRNRKPTKIEAAEIARLKRLKRLKPKAAKK